MGRRKSVKIKANNKWYWLRKSITNTNYYNCSQDENFKCAAQKDDKAKQVMQNRFYSVINNQQFISSPYWVYH